jgi:hypothetical protein
MLTETQPEVPTKQHNQVPGSRTSHSADSLCKSSTMDETATPQRENESEVASREIIGIVGHREYYDPIKGFTTLYKVKSRKQLKHADDDDGDDDDKSDLEDEQWLVREEIVGVDDDEGDDAYQHGALGEQAAEDGAPAPALGLSREMQSAMSMSLRLTDEGTSHSSLLHRGSSHLIGSNGGSKNSAFDLLRAYEVEKQIPVDETESSFASGDMPAGLDGHSRSSLNPSSFSVEGGDDGVSDEGDRVELILSHRNFGGPGDDEYLVQWVGCSPDDDEWVPRIDLIVHERELVLAFEREQADQGAAYVWVPPAPEVDETSPETKRLNVIRHELATTMLTPIINNAIQQRARQACVEAQSVAKPEPRNPPAAVDSTSQSAADVEPGEIIGIVGHREYYDPIKGFTTLYKVKSRKQLKSDNDDSEYDQEEGGDEEQWLDREAIVGSDDEGDDDAVYEYGAFGEQGTESGERAPALGLSREMQSAMSLSLRFSDEGTSHSSLLHCGSSRSMASNGRPKKAALDMLRAYEVEKQIPVDTESSFGSGGMPAGLDGHSRSSLNPSSFSVEGGDDNVSDEGDRVELIVSHRNTGGFGDDEYLVRWMGCSSEDDEWVPRIDLIVHERDLVLSFESTRPSLAKLHQSPPMKRAMSVMLEGSIPKNRLRAIRLELAATMLVPILEDCIRRRAHLDCIAARQRDIAQFANLTAGEAISVAIARVSRRHVSGPAAIVIQACMRRYLGRRKVKQRFAARTIVCCCRWYLLNMRCDYRRQQVWGMITKVRAHTRSAIFGAQVRSRALRKTDAALRIQCARRTVVARRTLANRKRRVLNAVVLIQRSVRGYTARKAFARRRKRYHGACRLIQCVWRGFVARRQWRHTLRSHRFEALVNVSNSSNGCWIAVWQALVARASRLASGRLGLFNWLDECRQEQLFVLHSCFKHASVI